MTFHFTLRSGIMMPTLVDVFGDGHIENLIEAAARGQEKNDTSRRSPVSVTRSSRPDC